MDEINAQLDNINIKQALGLGLVLGVLYYALLFNDGRIIDADIREANASIQRDTATLAKVEKALEDKKRFETEIREITNYMKEFQEYFPVSFSGNTLEARVTEFSQKYKLTILSLKQVAAENEFKNYPETVVELEVEGEYHDIMNFIADITKIKKAMDFKKMRFGVAQQAEDPKIRLKTTLTVYGNTDGFGADNG